jgi:hypothetical protein
MPGLPLPTRDFPKAKKSTHDKRVAVDFTVEGVFVQQATDLQTGAVVVASICVRNVPVVKMQRRTSIYRASIRGDTGTVVC